MGPKEGSVLRGRVCLMQSLERGPARWALLGLQLSVGLGQGGSSNLTILITWQMYHQEQWGPIPGSRTEATQEGQALPPSGAGGCLREVGCVSLWDDNDLYAIKTQNLVVLLREVAETGFRT